MITRQIKYFRMVGGVRVPYELTLDAEDTAISDCPSAGWEFSDQAEVLQKFPHLAAQIAGGAKFIIREDGALVASHVPKQMQDAYRFFAGSKIGFEGEDALRAEYEDRIASPDCTDCGSGAVMREMLPIVLAAIAGVNK